MASVGKLHIHRWTRFVEANLLTVAMAQTAAVSADMMFNLMRYVREGVVDDLLPPRPDLELWQRLYRDHRPLTVAVGQAVADCTDPTLQDMLDSTNAIRVWSAGAAEEIREWVKRVGRHRIRRWLIVGWREGQRAYKSHLQDLAAMLHGDDAPESDDFGDMLRRSPEVYFYFRVVLPCVCIHRRLPVTLLRQARRGNEQAIEQLVRVDDLAIHDPGIVRWWSEQTGETRRVRRDLLHQWASEGLNHGQFNRGRVKIAIGGLITAMIETVGAYWCVRARRIKPGRITAAQVQSLFNAVAMDRAVRKHRGIVDPDLGDLQPDSIRRMMASDKRLWRAILVGGSKLRWV